MQFLLYLSLQGQGVYQQLKNQIRFAENTAICRTHTDTYGWYESSKKLMNVCTSTILKGPKPNYYVNETLFHEATHYVQQCKGNGKRMVKLGLNPIHLPQNKLNDVLVSLQYSNDSYRQIEIEAYFLEDKPDLLKHYLKKYCF